MGQNKLKFTAALIIPLISFGAYLDSGLGNKNEQPVSEIQSEKTQQNIFSGSDIFSELQKQNDIPKTDLQNEISNISAENSELKVVEEVKSAPIETKPPVKTVTKKQVAQKIGIPGEILSETRIVNGKNVCKDEKDKPKKSKKNPKGHIDSQCCLDPGETPNSNCYYPPEKYGALIQKYLNSKK